MRSKIVGTSDRSESHLPYSMPCQRTPGMCKDPWWQVDHRGAFRGRQPAGSAVTCCTVICLGRHCIRLIFIIRVPPASFGWHLNKRLHAMTTYRAAYMYPVRYKIIEDVKTKLAEWLNFRRECETTTGYQVIEQGRTTYLSNLRCMWLELRTHTRTVAERIHWSLWNFIEQQGILNKSTRRCMVRKRTSESSVTKAGT